MGAITGEESPVRSGSLWAVVFLCFASALHAQADKYSLYQLSGSYSWLSNSLDGVAGSHQPLNGWDAALECLRWHGLRFKFDVAGYEGTNLGAPQKPVFILAGGQFNHRFGRETAWVEGLFGDGGSSPNWLPNNNPGQTASFAAVAGGGLDTPLNKAFAIRVQADFQYSTFGVSVAKLPTTSPVYLNPVHGLPNDFARIATGLVWRF